MPASLYDISVATYLQTLGAMSGVLERGFAHCRDAGVDPESIVETRLWGDMLPFRFQIVSVAHHSLGAIEGVKAGVFGPPTDQRPHAYADLQTLVAETREKLAALTAAEVNALEGREVTFQFGSYKVPFVAENFILSFSHPNFYFHAATAYDILRSKGAPLGKRDFMGQMRMKAPA
jgi:uncharacterized protein